jgi:hypothetical protein
MLTSLANSLAAPCAQTGAAFADHSAQAASGVCKFASSMFAVAASGR